MKPSSAWIARGFLIGGSLLLLTALLWWGIMYSMLLEQGDRTLASWSHCLVLPAADCNFYRGMAWMRGQPPYEPGLAWAAVSLLLAGAALRRQRG